MGKSKTEIFAGLKGNGFETKIKDAKTFTEAIDEVKRKLEKAKRSHSKRNRSH